MKKITKQNCKNIFKHQFQAVNKCIPFQFVH